MTLKEIKLMNWFSRKKNNAVIVCNSLSGSLIKFERVDIQVIELWGNYNRVGLYLITGKSGQFMV